MPADPQRPTLTSVTPAKKERHSFFLNPYQDIAFTRCPKCEATTKIRKVCLMISIEPHYFISLNKTCRYCLRCDLVIAGKAKLEGLLCAICEKFCPEIIGNEYTVFGTMDRADWRRGLNHPMKPREGVDRTYFFKDVWHFKALRHGWVRTASSGPHRRAARARPEALAEPKGLNTRGDPSGHLPRPPDSR